ncbi:spore germination protein GerPE [Gracilibacillus halophilus YIM-C55.5]|uniref:Spore germination protein GerPE n=1 Tax=Gracilibacillus halophilus YIM-C55.5 TaxID=1308866 RepID=N4WHJ3_9BACI|nr:spore germination protein GerPE [Gracilibacillus halophilus]ENH95652.1 spore germination protein GerPE [Gracilibacillus halophilus YIM-C55.5]
MRQRTTKSKAVKVGGLSHSSVFHIGDAKYVTPNMDGLAVQREGGFKNDQGFELSNYPIFQAKPALIPTDYSITQTRYHHHPEIRTPYIRVTALSTSAILQLGNVKQLNAQAKLKHIRIIKEEDS